MRKAVAVFAVGLVCSFAAAQLFDNGPFITHPGKGFGGADVSMASLTVNSGGNNMFKSGTSQYYRCADDFIVKGGAWNVTEIQTYGYASNAPKGAPGWTGFDLKIWQGTQPGQGSPVFTTTAAPTIAFTNVYRTFNGATNLQNTARAVNKLTWSGLNLNLPDGQYWVDVQVSGGSSGWWNYVMTVDPNNPDNPITKAGNAYQFSTTNTWVPAVAGTPSVNVEFPFAIVPEPSALALMVLGLVIRRR